jgi:Bifunctional DNA primase/polymerase, N-terminal
MTTFKDRAQIGIERGIPVIRINARAKSPMDKGWPTLATLDPEIIANWEAETPGANSGFVAQAKPGGIWILETDSVKTAQKYEQDTGKKIEADFIVQSSKGVHRYYLHNAASIAMGNIPQEEGDGFSVRANNEYCLGPLSVHPTGATYTTRFNGQIKEADPDLIAWLVSLRKQKPASTPTALAPGEKIKHGGIHAYMLTQAGRLRAMGLPVDLIETNLLYLTHEFCAGPIDDSKVKAMARSVGPYAPGTPSIGTTTIGGRLPGESVVEVSEPEEIKLASLQDVEVLGMPDDIVPDCRLGEIFRDRMSHLFPIDYGWLSLIHCAGVLVPPSPRNGLIASDSDDLTNLYTALVGPTGSGKSASWTYARQCLGINSETKNFYDVKAGSAETLFKKIQEEQRTGTFGDQLLLDVDEYSHLFKKIGIDGASFASILTSGFYKKIQNVLIGGGKDVSINCAISWIGGIVSEEFEDLFGSSTIGGLYDRFMFGVCPTEFRLAYQKFQGPAAIVNPVAVDIDPSVYEATAAWRKDHPEFSREQEIATRFAKISASFDGRRTLYGKDMEGAPLQFAIEQNRIRSFLKPNPGDTPDAKIANAVISLLQRKTKPGEWMTLGQIKYGVNTFRMKLGPNVLERALNSLSRQEDIECVNGKGRSKLIRLVPKE